MRLKFPDWSPPANALSVLAFSGTLTVPDGPFKGDPCDLSSEAPQQVICDVLDGNIKSPDGIQYKTIITAWNTQSGKSLSTVLVPSLHAIVERRESCVYCLPTADLLNKVWIDKLHPAIRGTGLGDWLPKKGPGSRDGRPTSLPFIDPDTGIRAGSMIFVAGGSGKKREAGQAGVTACVVVIDEADEYETAHRIHLIRQRAAAFGSDAIVIITSTVKKDVDSVILSLLKDSTDSRMWYACLKCGRFQPLEWEQVRFDGDNDVDVLNSARYECMYDDCKHHHTENDRRAMLANYRLVHAGQEVDEKGNVVGVAPRSLNFGLLCSKLDFAIGLGIGDLAVEYRQAERLRDLHRDHGAMRSFYRDRLSRMYTKDREEIPKVISNKFLSKKSAGSTWTKRTVPSWAERLFLSVDVQHDRVYWSVIGVTKGMRWAPIDWGYEYGSCQRGQAATDEQRIEQLNIVRDMAIAGWGVAGEDEKTISPDYSCVDVGWQTDVVTAWINAQGRGWIAVRGVGEGEDEKGTKAGSKENDLQGWGEIRHIEERGERWLFCTSQTVVRWMHDSLMRPSGHEGTGELPLNSDGEPLKSNDALLLHITQNVWDFDIEKGKWYWRRVHSAGRRDLRDCIKYGLTLAKFFQVELEKKRQQRRARRKGIKQIGSMKNARQPGK